MFGMFMGSVQLQGEPGGGHVVTMLMVVAKETQSSVEAILVNVVTSPVAVW